MLQPTEPHQPGKVNCLFIINNQEIIYANGKCMQFTRKASIALNVAYRKKHKLQKIK